MFGKKQPKRKTAVPKTKKPAKRKKAKYTIVDFALEVSGVKSTWNRKMTKSRGFK